MGVLSFWLGLLSLLLLVLDSLQDPNSSSQPPNCNRLPDIYWNASNPIFRIDNTDHIIDVNRDNLPYDQVNIICPVYAPGTNEEDAEKYIIYNVSKEEYDTCRITNPNPRIIAVCDKPHKLMYFTITFRSFTPQPGGLEFRPGQDYYFISTSSRDDLHRRVGGRCSTHNMKVVFKVCCHPGDAKTTAAPTATKLPASSSPAHSFSSSVPTLPPRRLPAIVYTPSYNTVSPPAPASTPFTTRYPLLPPYNPTRLPPPPKKVQYSTPNIKPISKKKDLEKHQNEVVKNEELTSGGSGVRWWSSLGLLPPLLLLLPLLRPPL